MTRAAEKCSTAAAECGDQAPDCMLSRLAHFVLGIHILKKAARLSLADRLRYLLLARRVHGAVIVMWIVCAFLSAFIATCCIYPHFAVIIHLDKPADEAVPDVWTFAAFFAATVFSAVGTLLLFVT